MGTGWGDWCLDGWMDAWRNMNGLKILDRKKGKRDGNEGVASSEKPS